MTIFPEILADQFANNLLIIDDEDTQTAIDPPLDRHRWRFHRDSLGQPEGKCGPYTLAALDIYPPLMALNDTVDDRQSKPRAQLSLGREERFKTPRTFVFRHAD